MARRLSAFQYTIMRNVAPKDGEQNVWPTLKIDKAIALNQAVFASLIRGDLVRYDFEVDAFRMTRDGLLAMDMYRHGDIASLNVKNNPEPRQDRVRSKITGQETLKRKRSRPSKKAA